MKILLLTSCLSLSQLIVSNAFTTVHRHKSFQTSTALSNDITPPLGEMATSRFPTSPEDQVRQAAISIKNASKDGIHRHAVRLLLPLIGATELDDWPGGARQMMEAASPLINTVMMMQTQSQSISKDDVENKNEVSDSISMKMKIAESVIDESDGVRALFGQAPSPKDDCCSILLPSADTVDKLMELDQQVGKERNLIVVNSQWRRMTDFGMAFFGKDRRNDKIQFVETFEPTFHCSNIMVEGDIVRVLRTYPGPWRVYLRVVEGGDINPDDSAEMMPMYVDWLEIGSKELIMSKTKEWVKKAQANDADQDGGKLFDYGIPNYNEITVMITSREGYVPKSLSERAAAAFSFIKDTL